MIAPQISYIALLPSHPAPCLLGSTFCSLLAAVLRVNRVGGSLENKSGNPFFR